LVFYLAGVPTLDSNPTLQCDVLVVGCGPVGMTVAALLGQQGISTIVVEQNPSICLHPRAQTIDDESMRTMQAIGIAARVADELTPAAGSGYYDADNHCFASIGPGPQNYGYAKRNYMLQQDLERQLLARLRELDCVALVFNETIVEISQDDEGVIAEAASGCFYQAHYTLACDGGQSSIRAALGIEMLGNTYERDWIVLDTIDDPDTECISRFICDPARPQVSIYSPRGGRRYEFMLRDGETREQVLTDEFLTALLAPYRDIDASQITRRAVYRFHARIASRLREGRVLLLGDAAHLSPPFAGQGMNAGIRDAHNVAWKIAGVLRHSFHADVLDSYDNERRGPIWAMIQLAVAMGEFVMPVGAEQLALTRSLMAALERFPEAHDWIFQMKFKPRPRYGNGLFIDLQRQAFEASLVGEMIPQPAVMDERGQTLLLDHALGNGYSLLAQDDAGERCVASLHSGLWSALAPSRVRLLQADSPHSDVMEDYALPRYMLQADDDYARPLRTHRDQILLIRPDRYVAGAFFPAQAGAFTASLFDLLTEPVAR
jgi:3-(3-hydroxy-phenyl)propionate hydroxylase